MSIMTSFNHYDIVVMKRQSKISKERKRKMNTTIYFEYFKSERQNKALHVKQGFDFAYIFFDRMKRKIVVGF